MPRKDREKSRRNHQHHTSGQKAGAIFDVLKRDHRRIVQLIEELEETSDDALQTRTDMFRRLRDQLDFHSRAEESVVYSRLKSAAPTRDRILESIEEHHVVTILLGELDAMPKNHERWLGKLRVMAAEVRRHVEQEETVLFAEAQRVLDDETAGNMGVDMTRQKEAWLELARQSPTLAGVVRGMTQVAERLPLGAGMVAASVEGNPETVTRWLTRIRWFVPNRRRGVFGMMYRIATLPISLPLSVLNIR